MNSLSEIYIWAFLMASIYAASLLAAAVPAALSASA